MEKREETVIYPMGGEAFELAFEHDFPHLYYRICRLQDAMTAYYLKQDVNVLVGAQFRAKDVPYIGEVAFPAKQGKKFCERMERYFRRVPRDNAELPRPMFVVEFTVEYGEGDFERYRFDFRTYCEESVTDFCQNVRERGRFYRRLHVLRNYRKIAERNS